MRVIIAGGKGVGEAIAKELLREGHEVTVIDSAPEVCEHLLTEHPELSILCGDVTNPKLLEEAGIKNADAFIAVTERDDINVITAMLAKKYGVEKIILSIRHPVYREICEMLELKTVVDLFESAAIRIRMLLEGEALLELEKCIGRDFDLKEKVVTKGDQGKKITEILAEDEYPIVVLRKKDALIPETNLILEEGDKVVYIKKRKKPSLLHF